MGQQSGLLLSPFGSPPAADWCMSSLALQYPALQLDANSPAATKRAAAVSRITEISSRSVVRSVRPAWCTCWLRGQAAHHDEVAARPGCAQRRGVAGCPGAVLGRHQGVLRSVRARRPPGRRFGGPSGAGRSARWTRRAAHRRRRMWIARALRRCRATSAGQPHAEARATPRWYARRDAGRGAVAGFGPPPATLKRRRADPARDGARSIPVAARSCSAEAIALRAQSPRSPASEPAER